ncbi:MAG: bifunctional phosphopantothenoylcysteine decarboxylase/phosphopantothenate--cysteine ligase CoaBC [Deltaproteobacteria bacterium]
MTKIEGKNIILGVTGGIAAYKACELVRMLVKAKASVQVIMTKNAMEFVTPLTFQTLSGRRVAVSTFDTEWESEIGHIKLADCADLVVVAPATAGFIGKAASGLADNLLLTVILATKAPVMIFPAMNVNMYTNPAVQDNIAALRRRGFTVVEPAEGSLACGWEGRGRLPDVGEIADEINKIFSPQDLKGERIIVTAGATREFIDSVRFISNPSSGKMGYAIAKAAWMRGAEVKLISGKADVPAPNGVELIPVLSVAEMHRAVMDSLDWSSVVIKAAAVGDYSPINAVVGKIKKGPNEFTLHLVRTVDILQELGRVKNGKILVGFAAEAENIVENAMGKLRKKNLDLIVANDILAPGSGFGEDTNVAYFLDKTGKVEEYPLLAKSELAERILDRIAEIKLLS